ncbi:hypothetical protein ABZT02_16445 [Streptomyces sp. NPDC005402]|uniref:hypothetical protein n=1 Tax=Streptomyces sp. NPDC005402 TaxID=3155338 RepID=UPI0033A468BA
MDSDFDSNSSKSAFNRAAPTFAFFDPESIGNVDTEVATPIIKAIYYSLLISTGEKLPNPLFSMRYRFSNGGVSRLIGPYGREALLSAGSHNKVQLGRRTVRKSRRIFRNLRQAESKESAVWNAIESLSRTALIDLSPENEFVHCTIAIETLLMPHVRRNLKREFSRRVTDVCSAESQAAVNWSTLADLVYAVRSDILHGGDYSRTMNQAGTTPEALLPQARKILAACIRSTLLNSPQWNPCE